jgi:pimeloyl-ACP methyl ester carboxylesterase
VVRAKLARLIADHRGKEVIVFAHSYGTYLLIQTLQENPQLRISRAILYGSVVVRDFDWYSVAECFGVKQPGDPFPILNLCGVRDEWPVAAECMTTDFGSSGTRGFMNQHVRDSFSEGDHSQFLQPVFARSYWIPFVISGRFPDSNSATPLEHHDTNAKYWLKSLIWKKCALRHVVGAIYVYRYVLFVIVMVASAFLVIQRFGMFGS